MQALGELITDYPLISAAIAIWALFWKGMALWVSARRNQQAWYIILLLVNTLGILEIAYLALIRHRARFGFSSFRSDVHKIKSVSFKNNFNV